MRSLDDTKIGQVGKVGKDRDQERFYYTYFKGWKSPHLLRGSKEEASF